MNNLSLRLLLALFLSFVLIGWWQDRDSTTSIQQSEIVKPLEKKSEESLLAPISKPFKKTLIWIESQVGDWGLAIILLTALLKLITSPLQHISNKNAKRMIRVQPQIKELRETYKEDPQNLQKEMFSLFKEEKINPVLSIFPMLFQIPVFIAFFDMLSNAAGLFEKSSWLWVPSLATPDPFFILPVLAGAACFLQQKSLPAQPQEKNQKRVMKAMPLLATAFGIAMPAGVAIYMVTSSVCQGAIQWCLEKV